MSPSPQQIYSAFDPAPLHVGQNELYVDLEEVRGGSPVVERLRQKILLAEKPTCQVLAGHQGCGKSTELWRLRQRLESPAGSSDPAERFFVAQVSADDELDRNDIDFPDVLVALIRQLSAQLRDTLGHELKPGYFEDRWKRIKDLAFSEVDLKSLALDTGMARISGMIRTSPEARRKVREALEEDSDNWITAANDIIGQAVLAVREKHYRGLVIIFDNLDKMITRELGGTGCLSTEYLFIHRSAQLTAFQCHVVYTLPIELAYSHHEPAIRRIYGGHLPVVPMIKIKEPPPSAKDHAPGIKKMREIIRTRLAGIGAEDKDLFRSNKIRDDLIRLTGGQPTELMSQVREAIITDGIPITAKALDRCRFELKRSYRRQLRVDHWPLIQEARRTGQIIRTADNEKAYRELLDSRTLLLYRNHEEWYGLNPAVEDLVPPTAAQP